MLFDIALRLVPESYPSRPEWSHVFARHDWRSAAGRLLTPRVAVHQ